MNTLLVMMMTHDCEYEETIINQSRKIERLEARADYKHERMAEVNDKIDKLTEKIDGFVSSMTDLTLKSTNDDHLLDARLKAIETELALQKQTTQDNKDRTNQYFVIIGLFFTALTIYLNYFH